jgi:hypothetical protein
MLTVEIDKLESDFRILSYEGDDMLNEKFSLKKFFQFYFYYSGFIGFLKNQKWNSPSVYATLNKFPRLMQPAFFILVPLFFYSSGVYFIDSLKGLMIFFLSTGIGFFLTFRVVRKKIRKDILQIISISSEMRIHLNHLKKLSGKPRMNWYLLQ